MSSKWCAYFNETEPKGYRFLGFYEYRSKQVDFTFSFQKESYKLRMDLHNLMKDGSEESKETASRLNKIFQASTLVDFFYNYSLCKWWAEGALIATGTMECCLPYGRNVRYRKMEPLQLRWTMECCLPYGRNVRCTCFPRCTNFAWTIGVYTLTDHINSLFLRAIVILFAMSTLFGIKLN